MSRTLNSMLALSLGLFTLSAQALEVDGVRYEEAANVAGSKLQLNGAGTRYKAVFRVYTAGLYLGKKASSTAEVVGLPGAKRISMTMLRDINAEELGRLFIKGIKANTSSEEYGRILPSVMRMSQVFTDFKTLKAGQIITIDWVPGAGTVIHVNGKSAGVPITEPDFYAAMLRIWLGPDPADWQLKDALLGLAPKVVD